MVTRLLRLSALAALGFLFLAAAPPPAPAPKHIEDAVRLSWFGERPAFSPDGKRIAFIGKTFGDAYELEISTGRVRNLTAHLPHAGILRVQYLPNGDFLIIAPRHAGPNARWEGELWILDKNAERGLVPLNQRLFEGVAISRKSNLIGFATHEGDINEKNVNSISTEFWTAEIDYGADGPKLINKRKLPVTGCVGEAQDFRDNDQEMTFPCYSRSAKGGALANARGINLVTGKMTVYRDQADEYAEIEGIAPDGSWSAVECAPAGTGGLPPLDICRLELKPGGQMTRLLIATAPGSTRKVNNPVISPDGKWMAVASSDSRYEAGTGDGILLLKLAD
jgi:hypothetical protein